MILNIVLQCLVSVETKQRLDFKLTLCIIATKIGGVYLFLSNFTWFWLLTREHDHNIMYTSGC